MTLTPAEEERYHALADLEEQPDGEGTGGTDTGTYRGEEAAALGRQMLLDALGSEEAVRKSLGGRPRIGDQSAGAGESPTIRVRVTETRKRQISMLRNQQGMKHDSDIVRAALDEYVERHLTATAAK